MKIEGFTRFESIETQKRTKDLILEGVERQKAYDQALSEVHAGKYPSGWNLNTVKLGKSDFIVVLDLDETVLS